MIDYDSKMLRHVSVRAVLGVRDLLLDGFRSPMSLDFKRDAHDVVTEYDVAAEDLITGTLLRSFPGSAIIGEEKGHKPGSSLEWHIDPIDGTSNFARGLPFWCVSVGAVVEGTTVAGAVYDVLSQTIFSADLDGAYLNERDMRSKAANSEIGATIVTSFPGVKEIQRFGEGFLPQYLKLLNTFQGIRNLGSGALELALVAAGFADATFGFSTNSWDICAGAFLVRQSGGSFVGLLDGSRTGPDYLATDYYATGAGGDYGTLRRLVEDLSSQ